MIVAVDVDGVVANLLPEWLARYNADYGDCLTEANIDRWGLHEQVKPECGLGIYQYLNQPDLYDCVEPIEGALEGVNALRAAGHRVVFVTSTNLHQNGNKLRWLERHGFLELTHGTLSKDYIEAHDKSLVKASCMIDDCASNLETFQGGCLLFNQPHNRHASKVFHRAYSWKEVVSMIARGYIVRMHSSHRSEA